MLRIKNGGNEGKAIRCVEMMHEGIDSCKGKTREKRGHVGGQTKAESVAEKGGGRVGKGRDGKCDKRRGRR
jgi:hypothetical protein